MRGSLGRAAAALPVLTLTAATAALPAGCSSDSPSGASTTLADAGSDAATGAPETDTLPPRLIAHSPAADELNVSHRAPVTLTFSEALEPSSLDQDSVSLTIDGKLVNAQHFLSADQTELDLSYDPVAAPSRISVSLSSKIVDLAGNALEPTSFSWQVPLWQIPGGTSPVAERTGAATIAFDADDYPIVAYENLASGDAKVEVARFDGQSWVRLGSALPADSAPGQSPSLIADSTGMLFVGYENQANGSIEVRSYDNGDWTPLEGGNPTGTAGAVASKPKLALMPSGDLSVAWQEAAAAIQVWRHDGTWRELSAPWIAPGEIDSWDFALAEEEPVLAISTLGATSKDVHVVRYVDDAWLELGGSVDRQPDEDATAPQLALDDAANLYVAWVESSAAARNAIVARWSPSPATWNVLDGALDIEIDADVGRVGVAAGPNGKLVAAWTEQHGGIFQLQSATFESSGWQPLGGPANADKPVSGAFSLALSSTGDPSLAWTDGAETASNLHVKQYNSASPPFGLSDRSASPCKFPLDGDPSFPRTLTDTQCFTDVARRTPASGLIPYSINSVLWSDGALKRRFIVIPEGETIGYNETDGWQMPVGSILIKEFLAEHTPGDAAELVSMETRFLVKRCEPGLCRAAWQGYSYQWNDAGTEALLLENKTETVVKQWQLDGTVHTHSYPGRNECTQCHALAPGGVLGLQSAQMNRAFHYGERVDNQLRAMNQIGLFGDTFPDAGSAPRLPNPNDPSYSLQDRARAYFHANCSHCHRADGLWPVIDFRFDAPLVSAADANPNICNILVPGDAEASKLFVKDAAREPNLPPGFTGDPMPPLGTREPDTRQLDVTRAWIDGMTSCP